MSPIIRMVGKEIGCYSLNPTHNGSLARTRTFTTFIAVAFIAVAFGSILNSAAAAKQLAVDGLRHNTLWSTYLQTNYIWLYYGLRYRPTCI